jgi:hypothetical protein
MRLPNSPMTPREFEAVLAEARAGSSPGSLCVAMCAPAVGALTAAVPAAVGAVRRFLPHSREGTTPAGPRAPPRKVQYRDLAPTGRLVTDRRVWPVVLVGIAVKCRGSPWGKP